MPFERYVKSMVSNRNWNSSFSWDLRAGFMEEVILASSSKG